MAIASPWPAASGGYADQAHAVSRILATLLVESHAIEMARAPEPLLSCLAAPDAKSKTASLIAVGGMQDLVDLDPAFAYFAGLPGASALAPEALLRWLEDQGARALLDELAGRHGLKVLVAGHSGERLGLWSTANDIGDTLTGRRMHAEGLARDVLKGLGADVVSVQPAEVVAALANGTISALESGNVFHALATGVTRVAATCVSDGITPHGNTLVVAMPLRVWAGFDRATQTRMTHALHAQAARDIADAQHNADLVRHMLARAGIGFTHFAPALASDIQRISEAVIADVATRDALSRRIDGAYLTAARIS
ncbi:MAG: hypothetical protein ACRCS9_02255 [Hyphomicrobium sp.]